jgi:hypothetical protein
MRKLQQLKKSAILAVPAFSLTAIASFADGPGSTAIQFPTLDASALIPIVTAFNQYSTVILPVGLGFIAVKIGIKFIPKLIGMFFK